MSAKIQRMQRLLQGIALLHIAVGLCFPLIANSALFDFYITSLNLSFNLSGNGGDTQATRFLIAIFGPTIASWGVLFLYAVNSAFARPTPRAWWLLFAGCLVWAPYDSVLSMLNGVYINAVINAIAFPLIVTPLLMAKSHFHTQPETTLE